MIPGLAEALFSVLDGGRGAVADTGHAVGAAFAPDGPGVPEGDAVGGTAADALAAAGAGLRNGKGAGLDEAGIEDGVVVWLNGEIDCAPEYMYEHSCPYEDADNDIKAEVDACMERIKSQKEAERI